MPECRYDLLVQLIPILRSNRPECRHDLLQQSVRTGYHMLWRLLVEDFVGKRARHVFSEILKFQEKSARHCFPRRFFDVSPKFRRRLGNKECRVTPFCAWTDVNAGAVILCVIPRVCFFTFSLTALFCFIL